MAEKQEPKEWVEAQAKDAAAFYKTLMEQGVPEMTAANMTQEFNHQALRGHFSH